MYAGSSSWRARGETERERSAKKGMVRVQENEGIGDRVCMKVLREFVKVAIYSLFRMECPFPCDSHFLLIIFGEWLRSVECCPF